MKDDAVDHRIGWNTSMPVSHGLRDGGAFGAWHELKERDRVLALKKLAGVNAARASFGLPPLEVEQ